LEQGLILQSFLSSQGPVRQKEQKGSDSLPLSPDVFTHIKVNRLKVLSKIISFFLAVKESLQLLFKQGWHFFQLG
jgi:hypothetical protein